MNQLTLFTLFIIIIIKISYGFNIAKLKISFSFSRLYAKIKTPEVLRAFERAKIRKLPREVKQAYLQEDLKFNEYSEHTAKLVEKEREEGREEGRKERERAIALNLIKISKLSDLQIARGTGLSETEVQEIRKNN